MSENLLLVDYQWPANTNGRAIIALIGEAPGADEVKLGRPFVGRAGQMLDRALDASGIDRGRCFVGNVFRMRPPDNKLGHFFASRRRAAAENLSLAEIWGKLGAEFCLSRYAGELDALSEALHRAMPTIVVALGRAPLWALTGLNGITALRGSPLACRLCPAPVVATFHPSFVLRQNSIGPETEMIFRADLALARALAEQGYSTSSCSASTGIGAPG